MKLALQTVSAALLAALALGCSSARNKEFALADEDYMREGERSAKQLYITGTAPVDSIDPERLAVDIWKFESKDYPDEIRAIVRVYDSLGRFVTNMARPYATDGNWKERYWQNLTESLTDYVVTDSLVRITEFDVREYGAKDSIPYSIVLALDHGGSMRGAIDALQDGAELFISMKMPWDRIGVVKFDRKAVVEIPVTGDPVLLARFRKNELEGYGGLTSVFDAARDAMMLLANESSEAPRVLVLFTDGEDNISKFNDGDLIRLADSLNVHIFPIGFGYTDDEVLTGIAKATGGKYYKAYSKSELVEIFKDLYLSLRNFYKLTYKPPVFEGVHKVAISVRGAEGAKELKAVAEYDKMPLDPFAQVGNVFSELIFFDYNKSTIRPESAPILDKIAGMLLRYRRFKIEVRGHTDNIGGEEFNQRLSDARANAVRDALIARGVSERRLRARGLGLTRPLVPNDTEENRQKNRRTEFAVIAR